jgi:hypothetical protein
VFWILGLTLPSIFLMSILSRSLWEHWILDRVQFPWRLLVFVDLAAALGIAALFQALRSFRAQFGLGALAVAAILAANPFIAEQGQYSGKRWEGPVVMEEGAFEYFPPPLYEVFTGRMGVDVRVIWVVAPKVEELATAARTQANTDRFELAPRAARAEFGPGLSEVYLPMPYWQHWRAWDAAGAPLVLAAEPEFGMMVVTSPDGAALQGPVTLSLPWQWSERLGAGLSLLSALILVLMVGYPILRGRRAGRQPA